MKKWGALEYIVLLLTVLIISTVAGSWIVGLVRGTVLDDTRIKIMENIYAGTLSVITLYVGAQLQKRKDDK